MDAQIEHQIVNDARRQKQPEDYEIGLQKLNHNRIINGVPNIHPIHSKEPDKHLFNEQLIETENETKNRILHSTDSNANEEHNNSASSSDSATNLSSGNPHNKKARKGEYKSRESEQRRRDRINEGLTKLKDLLPAKNQTKKKKKVEIILEAAQHIEELKTMCTKLNNENTYLKRNLNDFDGKMTTQEKMYNMNVLGSGIPSNLVSQTAMTSTMQLGLDDSMTGATTSVPQNHKRKFIAMDNVNGNGNSIASGQHMPVVPTNSMHPHINTPSQYHMQNSVSGVQPTPNQYQTANGNGPNPSDYPTPSLQIDNNNLYALRALQSFSPFTGNTVPALPNSLHVSRPSAVDLTGSVLQNSAATAMNHNWHPIFANGYNSHIPPISLSPANNNITAAGMNTNSIYGSNGITNGANSNNNSHAQLHQVQSHGQGYGTSHSHVSQQQQQHHASQQQSGSSGSTSSSTGTDSQVQSNGQQPPVGYHSGGSSDGNSNGLPSDSPPSPSSSSSSDNAS